MNYSSINKVLTNGDSLIKEIAKANPNEVLIAIKKMSLSIDKDIEALINGKKVYIKKDFGLEIDYSDPDIKSFDILTSNVTVYAIFTFTSKAVI